MSASAGAIRAGGQMRVRFGGDRVRPSSCLARLGSAGPARATAYHIGDSCRRERVAFRSRFETMKTWELAGRHGEPLLPIRLDVTDRAGFGAAVTHIYGQEERR
jgi:hypothetical protein